MISSSLPGKDGHVSASQQRSKFCLGNDIVFEARPDSLVFTNIGKEFVIGLIECERKTRWTSAVRFQEAVEVIAMVSTLPDPEQGQIPCNQERVGDKG